jgi:hypothetical protein
MTNKALQKKAARAGARGKDIAEALDPEATVRLLVDKNPKTRGKENYRRFGAMMRVMGKGKACSVAEAREAGVTVGDLRFNATHGYVRIEAAKAKARREPAERRKTAATPRRGSTEGPTSGGEPAQQAAA